MIASLSLSVLPQSSVCPGSLCPAFRWESALCNADLGGAAPLASLGAALRAADAGVLVVLALFAWWGARRGALRQVLSLSVLVGAFFVAGALAPRLEPTVAKLTDLAAGPRLAAAWVVVLFCALVVGAILLRWVAARLPEPGRRPADRWLGGALGLLKGCFVGLLLAYALLAAGDGEAPTPLSRTGDGAKREASVPLVERMHDSLAAHGMASGADLLESLFELPPWVQQHMDELDERLGTRRARRPRGP